ncbi:hypothetical protein [Leptospira mtsangambouensis]|uniref:hypothetical protein n=1 Tax=Leptospira mtsangambouensis TaxID=2484912 RepID=UPI001EEA3D5C|nr:hypothetical protein [Leptospira mtsangambouensis]MCG6142796.1 hypothetical protein [Leptospira mtsangambouensis]
MNETNENFNFEKDLIYIDSNIINYLHNKDRLEKNLKSSIQCFEILLERLLAENIFKISYSHAHYLDINQGPTQFIEQDLENLFKITKGTRIQEDYFDDFKLKIFQISDIKADFKYCIEQTNNSNPLAFILKPLTLIVQTGIKVSSFFVQNKKHKDLINKFADALIDFDNGLEILRINKEMRSNFQNFSGIKVSFPNVHQLPKKKQTIDVKEMANEALKNSFFHIIFKNYQDFFDFNKTFNNTFTSKFNQWILKLTSLAEFIGLVSEELKSPTAFGSITNDNIHLTYGLSCQFFLTADTRLYKKAKFIINWLNLKSRVFLVDEFIEYVLESIYLSSLDIGLEPKSTKFIFNDSNGNAIKEYIITI